MKVIHPHSAHDALPVGLPERGAAGVQGGEDAGRRAEGVAVLAQPAAQRQTAYPRCW